MFNSVTLENIIRIFSDRSQRTFQSFQQRAYLSKKLQPKSKFKKPRLPLIAPTNPNPNRPFPQSDGIKRSKLIKEGTKTDRPISLLTLTPPYINLSKDFNLLTYPHFSILTLLHSLRFRFVFYR